MKAMRRFVFVLAIACAAAAGGSLIQSAPPSAAEKRNPLEGNEQAQRAGAKLYANRCASCHGNNREGRENVPPLNLPEVQKAASGTLFWVLRNGSLHRGMPSFAHLPEAQRWQIVTLLKSATAQR
jgi:mono/diheme cytochrome c family protein